MAVAELLLSPLITVLLERLASSELLKVARQDGIHTQINKWSNTLEQIQAVLADAEERQITEKPVKLWLEKLQDLALDLDDILDELATEALRRKLFSENQASTGKVRLRKLLPTCCSNFTPKAFMFNYKMGSKLEEISARFEGIANLKNNLDLKVTGQVGMNKKKEIPQTTSLVDEAFIFGRRKDKEEVVKLLTGDDGCNAQVSVLPIVGMGGLGKTTLAQLVYNDKEVSRCFDVKAWVCVSEEFDVFMISNIIYQSVASDHRHFDDLNRLQVSLQEKLSGRKFLIVLDDVWNENYSKWDLLGTPLRVGAAGSKIIVTTRIQGVASTMGSVPAYRLDKLTTNDCLSLLVQHALGTENFEAHPNLRIIGDHLATKCDGLPLAAKTLGGLLRTKTSQAEWEEILHSKIWEIPEEKNDILPALRLSYHYLPSHLKQLFAYCSIFPKDYEFHKEELVLLWMAYGFLSNTTRDRTMEELGCQCFDELSSRSFFQTSSADKSGFVMHDLLNDLAQFVASAMCFRMDDKEEGDDQFNLFEKVRHISFIRRKYEVFKGFLRGRKLRTFLPLPIQESRTWQEFYLSRGVIHDVVPKLQYLRVLSLSGYSISELPNSIGYLKHLRYLNLSKTLIRQLPESVSDLYNLQTLLLRGCKKLSKLPTSIEKLINLRHFDNADTEKLKDLPLGMGKLTALQTLSKICLGGSNHIGIRELKNLSHLRGCLSVMGLHNVTDVEDATEANLSKKQGLDRLVMEWMGDVNSRDPKFEKEILDFLRPHRNLKRLEIRFYSGIEFPTWVGDASLANTVHLELVGCVNCTSLPSVGQLSSLKYLRIQGMPRVKSIGVEIFGADCLETLIIEDMLELEEWSSFTHVETMFSALCKLWIFNCSKLMKVSLSKLPSLCELKLRKCGEIVITRIVSLASLITLEMWEISGLCQVDEGIIKLLGALEVLNIQNCGDLKYLWKDEIAQQYLVSLRSLDIQECTNLICLTEKDQTLPDNLESISIGRCDKLQKLTSGLKSLISLEHLSIYTCPRLSSLSFTNSDLPPMLKTLEISNCEVLDVQNNCPLEINSGATYSQLERLSISSCQSLTSFPTGDLPSNLKVLWVWNCTNLKAGVEQMLQRTTSSLESLCISDWVNLNSLPLSLLNFLHLTELHIVRCPGLEYFPGNGLGPHLRILEIRDCMKLRSLPDHMRSLKSLEHLTICACPSLQSVPKGGLPPNLKYMGIWDLKLPLSQWGLRNLTSLDRFTAEFHDLVSFPDEHLLPASLTRLHIFNSSTLETISTGVEKLTSLEVLWVEYCPKLRSLPETLLHRLSKLKVMDCPLLKQRCLKEKGDYWPSIAYIPCVRIDGKLIDEI